MDAFGSQQVHPIAACRVYALGFMSYKKVEFYTLSQVDSIVTIRFLSVEACTTARSAETVLPPLFVVLCPITFDTSVYMQKIVLYVIQKYDSDLRLYNLGNTQKRF